jgi:hypothetical protein
MVATELNGKHATSAQADANFSASLGNLSSHKLVYWHRDLPPIDAELLAEHTVEATSGHVPGTLSHRDDLWDRCYQELMAHTEARLAQEIARFGGDCAHVHQESIEVCHAEAANEAWLHGRFSYLVYRLPSHAR